MVPGAVVAIIRPHPTQSDRICIEFYKEGVLQNEVAVSTVEIKTTGTRNWNPHPDSSTSS